MEVDSSTEIVSNANETVSMGIQYRSKKQSQISSEREEHDKEGHWSEIPSLPLERIYSFLEREDQVNMSLVCRKWSEGYGLPSVWKTFIFDLTDWQLSMFTCPVMKFVQKYSSMFRHVEVYYGFTEEERFLYTWCRHFITFLEILTSNSQLISVEFIGMSHCLSNVSKLIYDDICRAIVNFLGSQHHIRNTWLYIPYSRLHEGSEILRKLRQNNRMSLTHLKLRGFVRWPTMSRNQNSNFAPNPPTLADFPNLMTLETDYTLTFERMVTRVRTTLQTVKNFQNLALSKIILEYQNTMINIEDFQGLTSTDWKFLTKLSPNLQVELTIYTDSPSRREVEFLIVPNMPITLLIYGYEAANMEIEMDVLFNHLLACKTNDYLVSLELRLWCPSLDLVSSFIPFLPACQKLKFLRMYLRYPANVIDLMKYWLDNRPQYLEEVNIYIYNIEDIENYTVLKNITFEYISRLQSIGMKVVVDIEENFRVS